MSTAPPTQHAAPSKAARLVLLTAVVTALLTAVATVSALAASERFTDVFAGNVHEPGISFMAESGVTAGCTADEYCPGDPVTRAQMGTFMHRLSGNAPGIAPSVDAATLQGLSVAEIQAGVEVELPESPDAGTTGDLAAIEERLLALEEQVEQVEILEERVEELEALLSDVTREEVNGDDTLRFSGMNVQVVNGTDSTAGEPNGLGNLLVGYDRERSLGTPDKSGSHYLVVGDFHNYTSYGGIVAGFQNNAAGTWASVLGGALNTAEGTQSVVVSGAGNTTSGQAAVVGGGAGNEAGGQAAIVVGGFNGDADGQRSVVVGGSGNSTSVADQIAP